MSKRYLIGTMRSNCGNDAKLRGILDTETGQYDPWSAASDWKYIGIRTQALNARSLRPEHFHWYDGIGEFEEYRG